MKVFIVTMALHNDPLVVDSAWSALPLAEARINWLMADDYFSQYGVAYIVTETLDSKANEPI